MQPKNNIRIGTRNSALALWQANHIGRLLEAAGMTYELVAISTIGDKILDRSLAKIGAKGVFTEELETMLRTGDIDIAQHSAKDLPSTLATDLPLLAFTEREAAHDVVLSTNPSIRLGQTAPLRIGTSSTRRRAFLAHQFPQHTAVEMRGNLQTRLEKLKNGDCDAMLLAFAGVHRMDMEAYIVEHLPLDTYVPAVGQGSVAIQCSTTLAPEIQALIRTACNHTNTEQCIWQNAVYWPSLTADVVYRFMDMPNAWMDRFTYKLGFLAYLEIYKLNRARQEQTLMRLELRLPTN